MYLLFRLVISDVHTLLAFALKTKHIVHHKKKAERAMEMDGWRSKIEIAIWQSFFTYLHPASRYGIGVGVGMFTVTPNFQQMITITIKISRPILLAALHPIS